MKNKKILFYLILILYYVTSNTTMVAQNGIKISGQVIDETNESLPGVNVLLKGANIGVVTDIDGNFHIDVPSEKSILVFSFIGYDTQEIKIGKQRVLKLQMKSNTTTLDDVVVIAYGTQKKATLTGALSTANTERLVEAPVAAINNVLAGAVPGVSTVQTTGQPGKDAAKINIRGIGSLTSADPLVLVDGVERDFSQLDPNEIENLSVLKDASATAVFGVRGANGVILVTTKRGNKGKPTVNFSSINGVQQPMQYVRQVGSYEYATFWNMKMEADKITDPQKYFTREDIEAFRTGQDPMLHPNIDWMDYLFNKVFFQSKNNISISGGTDDVSYFVSLGYMYQNGALKDTGLLPYNNNFKMNRYNYRANLDFKLSQTTKLKFGAGGNTLDNQEPNSDVYNPFTMATIWSIPMAGPGIINGVRTIIPKGVYPIDNPRDAFDGFFGKGYTRTYNVKLNLDVEITQRLDFITKGLSISIKGAYDTSFQIEKLREGGEFEYQYVYYQGYLDDKNKPWTDPDFDKTIVMLPHGSKTPLTYSEKYNQDRNWYLEGRINYTRSFGLHNVSGLFLYNQSRDYYPSTYKYLPRNYIGYVGRATYDYNSRYLAEINAGYNGSENFAPGSRRYGFFPSGSIGWIMSEEKFMKKQKLIDFLKLRASWGLVGNDRGVSTRFMYMNGIWTPNGGLWSNDGGYSFGVNNPVYSEAFLYGTPGNKDVTWETAFKQNYGVDLKALKARLSLSFDYFFEHRTGILITPQNTPSIIATPLSELNLGVVDNHGYELSLGWDEVKENGLRYYLQGNVSFARNKIIFMDEIKQPYDYMNITGGSIGRQSGYYQFERLYQYSDFVKDTDGNLKLNPELPQPHVDVYPGDCMYADLNKDGIVDSNDKRVAGYASTPEYVFGINGGITYKGFNFHMQWTGATHVSKPLGIEYRIPYTNAGGRGLLDYFYKDCWTPENQLNAKYPRAAETSETWNSENSTLWLQDASYLRLKTISLGYTMTQLPWLKSVGIKSMEILFTGYNLLTFSPMKIMDPETVANNSGSYPLIKVYSLGLNVKF